MNHRSLIKNYILKELESKDWRPSYIRSVLKGVKDKRYTKLPSNPELKTALFFSARINKTSINAILSQNRVGTNPIARQLIYYYFVKKNYNPVTVAQWFGYDRTTAWYGYKKFRDEIKAGYKPSIKMIDKFNTLMNESCN